MQTSAIAVLHVDLGPEPDEPLDRRQAVACAFIIEHYSMAPVTAQLWVDTQMIAEFVVIQVLCFAGRAPVLGNEHGWGLSMDGLDRIVLTTTVAVSTESMGEPGAAAGQASQ